MTELQGATTIVVGGGIMGATTLWELARAGADAALLEAGTVGCGSTGKSAAIVRTHYSNPDVVRMAVRSREALRRLPLLLECDPVYRRSGWLFLVNEAEGWIAAENSLMQEEEGAESVEVDDLEAYLPGIDPTGIAYALYEPDSGFADPVVTTAAYADAARRLGATVHESAPVEKIELTNGRIRGVRARGELLQCENVVLAAGAWSAKLAAEIGLELPVEVYREQDAVFDTSPEPTIPHAVSSQVDRVYLRPAPEAGASCVLVGRGFPKDYERVDPDGFDESVDAAFEKDVHERVSQRVPRLAGMRPLAGRVGLYTVTPDWHPLLGAVDGYDGLFLATGGSGHCFKLGPAIGELVAGAVLGRPPTYADVRNFSPARFAEGREFRSTYGGNRA